MVRIPVVAVAVLTLVVGCAPHADRPTTSTPSPVPLSQLRRMHARSPATGQLVSADIAPSSAFRHRPELVYLPPVWFGTARPPALPVVELIPGTHGGPTSWIRRGQAIQTADAYAAAHHGWAPILVFVDADGLSTSDSECVNGPRGRAEDHLARDVPAYVEKTFGAAANPDKWAVVGLSMGGTCAVDLTLVHPDVFRHFVDLAGDLGPNLGDKAATIATLYGGSAAAWSAHDPLTVLNAHGRYSPGTSGWFGVGAHDAEHLGPARVLAAATARHGIQTRLAVRDGGHDWTFGTTAFRETLPWLAAQL